MSVSEIFESMEYGPAPESAADALAWIVDQGGRFSHFIDGAFTAPGAGFDSTNPATGEVLASLTQATQGDVDSAVKAARKAQPKWEKLGGHGRARQIYALARLLQKHARLFAVLEVLDNGKPIREARDIDVPLAQRHFYYHAGMAQLMESELPDAQALGVCGQIIPWNFPLLMLAWKIAPALAMGNTVVLKPAEYTSLTALLFADICRQAGLPKGVVNIVTGDGAVGEMIVTHEDIDKIAFTGSTAVGRRIREATAGSGKALTLELGGKSPYIVLMTPIWIARSKGWLTRFGSIKGRSAVRARGCWCMSLLRIASMPSCARGWRSCVSVIRWTRALTWARWWTRCNTSA